MTSRGRNIVLAVSFPVMIFAVVGGFMGRTLSARQDSYQYLRIFEDVVTLILNNYVEEPNVDEVMHGAMHGLADGLDPDSAFLSVEQTRAWDQKPPPVATAGTGLDLTRQYYLRVIAARDGSPAATAGLRPGDYIRAIDGQSTRDVSVVAGSKLLQGTPGSRVRLTVLRGNAAEPRDIEITREVLAAVPVRSRMASPGTGYVRVAEFAAESAQQLRSEIVNLGKSGATRLVIDLRGTAFGDVDAGVAAARLFIASGTLAYRQERGQEKQAIASAADASGIITWPVALLTDLGTSGPAELFAASLKDNKRASLVGERTLGRAGRQKLVRLPNGSALLLTHVTYLTPTGAVIHEKGVTPDVVVEQPDFDFGSAPPTEDATLQKAIEQLASLAKAA